MIIFFILITCMFDQVGILYGEIRCHYLGLKGLILNQQLCVCLPPIIILED